LEKIINTIKSYIPKWEDYENILFDIDFIVQKAIVEGLKVGLHGRLQMVEHDYLIEVENLKFVK